MMEVENRIETFGGQVEELPDELKDRRVSGGSGGNGVILEEDEDSLDSIEGGLEKAQPDGLLPVNGRVIKKVNTKHCHCKCFITIVTHSLCLSLELNTVTLTRHTCEAVIHSARIW